MLTLSIALVLSACGGGSPTPSDPSGPSVSRSAEQPPVDTVEAPTAPSVATTSEVVPSQRKAAETSLSAVYRFLNTRTGAHFYTVSAQERDEVIANLPQFQFEGIAFYALTSPTEDTQPVYRFYNRLTGTHFYTIGVEERDRVVMTLRHIYILEGISWYASTGSGAGWTAMSRFYNRQTGTHFYTASLAERDQILATLPWMIYEGVAYYVRSSPPLFEEPPPPEPPILGFDPQGRMISTQGGSNADVAVQSDGKIVMGGACFLNYSQYCVMRFNVDGSPDTSFGDGGIAMTLMAISSLNHTTALRILADGKMLLSGDCHQVPSVVQNFCVARFHSDGTLDTTFATGGKYIAPMTGGMFDRANDLVVQSDGKLVLAGTCTFSSVGLCALRLNADGTPDNSFGTDGKRVYSISPGANQGYTAALMPGDKLLVLGSCHNPAPTFSFCAMQLNPDGSLDSTFGDNGILLGSPSGMTNLVPYDVVARPEGGFVVTGGCNGISGASDGLCVVGFLANGDLDTSFGTLGLSMTRVVQGVQPHGSEAIAMQVDGKFVVAGTCMNGATSYDFCAARFNADGSPDTGFGDAGKIVRVMGAGASVDMTSAVALQPNGQIVISGTCNADLAARPCMLRLALQ
jgi:uncharacterized delta-60 repeat protein